VGWLIDHAGVERQCEQLTLPQIELREKADDLDKRRDAGSNGLAKP